MAATVTEPAAPARPGGAVRADARVEQAGEQRSSRLESLRALGALSVIVTHSFTLALAYRGLADSYHNRLLVGGGNALQMFFAMSGYLLFLPFVRRQLDGGRPINVRRYARNRVLRIVPLYFTVIAVLYVVQPFDTPRAEWWRFALFLENFSPDALHRLDAPFWSVVIEAHFYVVLPLLAWAIARVAGRSIARTVALLAALSLASFALRWHEVLHAATPNVLGPIAGKYALPTFFYVFAAGMLLAVWRVAWERRPPRWAALPLLGASSAWIAAAVAVHLLICVNLSWQEPLIALAVFLLIGGCVLPLRSGRLVRALQWRPLAMLGLASYSLYLWHFPILEALSGVHGEGGFALRVVGDPTDFKRLLLVGVPTCVAVGVVSYLVVERPFLRRRERWGATAAAALERRRAPAAG